MGDIGFEVGRLFCLCYFVCLGEYYGEWYSVFSYEVEECHVFLLWFVTYVDEDEETGELFAVEDVVAYEVLQFVHFAFPSLCESVTWEVDKVPLIIDEEVVDEHCLSWCG